MGNDLVVNSANLEPENQWFQSLFNASITANVVVTLDSHRIKRVNNRFVALFGRPRSLDLDASLDKLFPTRSIENGSPKPLNGISPG